MVNLIANRKRQRHYLTVTVVTILFLCLLSFSAMAGKPWNPGWWSDLGDLTENGDRYSVHTTYTVEVGQTFELVGWFTTVYMDDETEQDLKTKMMFVSSDPKVAKIGKTTGTVRTLKPGRTRITVKCEGKKYTCTLIVVKRNALKTATTYRKHNEAARDVGKYYGVPITLNNYKKILTSLEKFIKTYPENNGYIIGDKLVVPNCRRAYSVYRRMYSFFDKCEDIKSFHLVITSLDAVAGKSVMQGKLSEKVPDVIIKAGMFQQHYGGGKDLSSKASKVTFDWVGIKVHNTLTGKTEKLHGEVTLTSGSNKIKIRLYKRYSYGESLKYGKSKKYVKLPQKGTVDIQKGGGQKIQIEKQIGLPITEK